MDINRYTDKQILVLRYLSRYKFLTYKQMKRLGIDKHSSNLSNLVKGLRESKYQLVRKIPHRRGTPVKHYLTRKGKEYLMELHGLDEAYIQFPKSVITTDTQDQKHRTSIIDIQIELDFACLDKGYKLLLSDRYFDKTGNNRIDRNLASKTAIIYEGKKTLKADFTFMLRVKDERELYLLELENGKDAKKAVPKILNHAKAIFLGSANEKYEYQKAYRTLWVFEYESTLVSVLKKLKDNSYLMNVVEFFLFKSLEDVRAENFFEGWRNLRGEIREML